MGQSSKMFLLDDDGTLFALAGTAFMRMLRREPVARLPDFAGRRMRVASLSVELIRRAPRRVVHSSFFMIDIDADGCLNVERLNAQQFARVDDVLGGVLQEPVRGTPVVDAANRFIARGGSWEPDHALRRRIDAVALGRLHCTRVRVAA